MRTEISEMESLMTRGPVVETGGHGGSWSYVCPYLDGTWTFRWCQPQPATSAAMLMNCNLANSIVTSPTQINVIFIYANHNSFKSPM